jgi:hypothetical protein
MPALFWGENRESHLMEANGDPNGKIAEKMHLPHENFRPGYMQQPVYDQDRAYVELLFHILRQLESLGFEVIVFIAGHYPLLRHARAACDWYSLDGKSQAWAVTGYELVRDQIPDAGDHAAGWETSLMMARRRSRPPRRLRRVRPPGRGRRGHGDRRGRPPAAAQEVAEAGSRASRLRCDDVYDWTRTILPAFRHFAHTRSRRRRPFTTVRTLWRLGMRRRLVRLMTRVPVPPRVFGLPRRAMLDPASGLLPQI